MTGNNKPIRTIKLVCVLINGGTLGETRTPIDPLTVLQGRSLFRYEGIVTTLTQVVRGL